VLLAWITLLLLVAVEALAVVVAQAVLFLVQRLP
jgi:hypothetical protein